jgi:hypothetical protein
VIGALFISVSAVGFVVFLVGWVGGVEIMRSLVEDWVTMKPSTAIGFTVAGLLRWRIHRHKLDVRRGALVGALSFLLLFGMAGAILNALTTWPLGFDVLFEDSETHTIKPGVPSWVTMFLFILWGCTGIRVASARHYLDWHGWLTVSGWASTVLGGLALVGYLLSLLTGLDLSVLTYYVPEVSTAMAVHTAILFTALGLPTVLDQVLVARRLT